MTMTITSPATPATTSTTSTTSALITGIAPAGKPGASEDFLLTGIVGRQPAPAGAPANATAPGTPAVPTDRAAQAPLFAHVMDTTTEGDATVAAPAAATAIKEPADTDTDNAGVAAAVTPAVIVAPVFASVMAPAIALPALAGNRYVAPAPVAADATVSTAVSGVAGTSAGATLYPSATPFNLPAANIAVTTPSGAAPQASYTALQDANQLALAQQAARVTEDIGAPLLATYGYASAVTPAHPQLIEATTAAAVTTSVPRTSGIPVAGMIPAVTSHGGTVADAAAPAVSNTAITENAVPASIPGLVKPFNPALATNAAAMPGHQAGAAPTTTAPAAITMAATADTTTTTATIATTAATAAPTTRAAAPAATARFATSEYAAAPAVATIAAEASGQHFSGRKAAAVTNAAPSFPANAALSFPAAAALPLPTTATLPVPAATTMPHRATAGAATSATIASYPAVAGAAQPRVMPAVASAGVDVAVPAPVAASRDHGFGMTSDDGQATAKFTSALAATAGATPPAVATAAPTPAGFAAPVKLAGAPEQWQQPLREALGDRLQVNLQRNNNQAVIRLDPPNMGSIEISIRQSAGALQVNLSASNSEVVRQLNAIGDSVRQDLATRQFSDVAVTVSTSRTSALSQATPQQSYAQGQPDGGRQQQQEQERGRNPGRALYQDDSKPIFAMNDQE
ncbi:flagellar hook-length control protein FliK [Duganella sp. FT27W]|uniref:flagellar hook-length control protein FliK n=1 Tax=Duganella sp. FT27W TaxID=2654636 RepID=UPI00128B942D|nr:flagellar hook-length control protein FliK [Duganella sp. FT27W]MPQ55523.1 hypothetical protein [Duganella sp. FT27W]